MKLKQLSAVFSGVVLCGLFANGFFLVQIQRAHDSVVSAQDHRQRAVAVTQNLRQETEHLTRLVRAYTSTAETRYLLYYYDILAIRQGEKPAPENFNPSTYWDRAIAGEIQHKLPENGHGVSLADKMKSLDFSQDEFQKLGVVLAATDAMKQVEQVAFAATQGLYDPKKQDFVSDGKPQLEFASRLVNAHEYNQLRAALAKAVDDLVAITDARTRTQVESAGSSLQHWIYLTLASMALTIVLVVLALQVIRRRVLRPIETLSQAAGKMALGDYSTRAKIGSGGEAADVAYSVSVRSSGGELAVDELLALGTTFDGMAESIEQDIKLRQQAQRELEAAHHIVHSSIQYASRIQRAILPPEDYFSGMIPDHFVLWEPRDVVGGDIYWCKAWGEGCLVILGDCTGHGVPGAFMTMLSAGALDRAIRDVAPGKVGDLIQHMHQILQHTLNQDSAHGHSDDGIEMGVCYLNADRSKMVFAGARFDLYVRENGVVNIIKGSKSGMGYRGIPYDQQFESQEISTNKNMIFYLASDGVVDQVGADTGWGVGRKRLISWMVEAGNLPLAEQKNHLFKQFLAYQGSAKRRDDVAVIGFRV